MEYGSPVQNMEQIAELWTAYLGYGLTAKNVAIMMTLMKISRTVSENVKMDTFEDAAAYIAIAAECAD